MTKTVVYNGPHRDGVIVIDARGVEWFCAYGEAVDLPADLVDGTDDRAALPVDEWKPSRAKTKE